MHAFKLAMEAAGRVGNVDLLLFYCFFRYKDYLPPRLVRLDPRMFCKVISECSCWTDLCCGLAALELFLTLIFLFRCIGVVSCPWDG